MPRMKTYLETNGPWSQLVTYNNIDLKLLQNDTAVALNRNLKVTPILVPHRDEFSETVGYRIEGEIEDLLKSSFPHSKQNRASGGLSAPQLLQRIWLSFSLIILCSNN